MATNRINHLYRIWIVGAQLEMSIRGMLVKNVKNGERVHSQMILAELQKITLGRLVITGAQLENVLGPGR